MKFLAFKWMLLWSVFILIYACQGEDDIITTTSDTSHTLSVTMMSTAELETDPVFATLQSEAFLVLTTKDGALSKSTNDYRIVETRAAVARFKDYTCYSFAIDNPNQPPFTFDNYVIRKQHNGTTEAFILRYAYNMQAWWGSGEKSFSSITAYDTNYLPLNGGDAKSTSVSHASRSPCSIEVMVYHQTPQDGTYEWTLGAVCHHTTEGDQCQIIIEYIITCDSGGGGGTPGPETNGGNPPGGESPGGGGALPDNGGPGQPIVTMEPPLGPENDVPTLHHLRESIEAPTDLSTTEAELQNKNNALAVYLNQVNPAVFQDVSLLLIEINSDPDLSKDDRLFLWDRAKGIYDIVKSKEESVAYHINSEEFFATLSLEQQTTYTENIATMALLPAVKSVVGLQWPSSTEEWLTVFELIKPMLIEIGIEFLPLGGLYNAIGDTLEGIQEGDYTLAGIGLAGVLMEFIPWTKLVKIGKALFRLGKRAFSTFKLSYPFLSQLSDALALGLKTVLEENIVKLIKSNGDEVARISNNTMHVSKHGIKAADGSVVFRSADEVNAEFPTGWELPYDTPEHTVTEFVTDQSEDVFIRVYNGDNIDGRWMIHIDEFNQFNNNAEAIRNALALPNLPTKYARVTIPQGSNVRSGIVNPQTWEDGIPLNGEALQFEILDNIDDTFIFTPLGDLN